MHTVISGPQDPVGYTPASACVSVSDWSVLIDRSFRLTEIQCRLVGLIVDPLIGFRQAEPIQSNNSMTGCAYSTIRRPVNLHNVLCVLYRTHLGRVKTAFTLELNIFPLVALPVVALLQSVCSPESWPEMCVSGRAGSRPAWTFLDQRPCIIDVTWHSCGINWTMTTHRA